MNNEELIRTIVEFNLSLIELSRALDKTLESSSKAAEALQTVYNTVRK